ncbi:hypothetical protein Q8F55_000867 [Vanrija albida]|uniref:Prolactin regulatory element-binding protein n=1 Tax=Vanrija albida TaxID=181172 RepID=A0ABR3QFF0_9TREE
MTRTDHHSHPTHSFPVYCLDWADNETAILGGGGGASRSGIANKFKLVKVSKDGRKVEPVFELALSSDEDAPMTIATDRAQFVTGINASQTSIEAGNNAQARLFSYGDKELEFVAAQQTLRAKWSDDYPYQKLTAITPGFVAVGTTDDEFAILKVPSLEIVVPPRSPGAGELVDIAWGGPNGSWLAVTTSKAINIFDFDSDEKTSLSLLQSIPLPSIDDLPLVFRAARFSPEIPSCPNIFAVLNSTHSPSRKGKSKARKAFVAKYAASVSDQQEPSQDKNDDEKPSKVKGITWELATRREVSSKPVTVFDISSNGQLVSFGSSDLSIGLLDTNTLAPLLKILQAHSFPPTALKFNPSATLLVSASADNTLRTIVIPSSFGGVSFSVIALILAILVIFIALLVRK